MRVPGVKSIAFISASAVGSDIELQALAGVPVDISALLFTPIIFEGDPSLELNNNNENNGENRHVVFSFVTTGSFKQKHTAFLVTTLNGAMYLIGSANNVPAISTKNITAGPSSTNHVEVTIELSSPIAWIDVFGMISIDGQEYYWREITVQEIDNIINKLTL